MTLNENYTKYFKIEEFVPKNIFKHYSTNSIMFLDPRVINLAVAYREFFNKPVVINNWHSGGTYQERGYRIPNSNTGARFSQHKFGRAFDCNIKGVDDQEAYNEIVKNFDYFKQFGLTTLENYKFTQGWIHSDCRLTGIETLLVVNP